jgi:hypothetical protein
MPSMNEGSPKLEPRGLDHRFPPLWVEALGRSGAGAKRNCIIRVAQEQLVELFAYSPAKISVPLSPISGTIEL